DVSSRPRVVHAGRAVACRADGEARDAGRRARRGRAAAPLGRPLLAHRARVRLRRPQAGLRGRRGRERRARVQGRASGPHDARVRTDARRDGKGVRGAQVQRAGSLKRLVWLTWAIAWRSQRLVPFSHMRRSYDPRNGRPLEGELEAIETLTDKELD